MFVDGAMDQSRHISNHPNNIGNTNRRFKSNYNSPANPSYQPSTTYSINFSLPASENVISRPYLPGQKNKTSPPFKNSYSSLNKYKLLEKELDKRRKEHQASLNQPPVKPARSSHSQSYTNIFSNKSPQFANRDKNSQLAKPNLIRSNATDNYQQTNSLNDLYKVEKLFDSLDQREDKSATKEDKSKSIEYIGSDKESDKLNDSCLNKSDKLDKGCNTSFDTSLDDQLNNNYIEIKDNNKHKKINQHQTVSHHQSNQLNQSNQHNSPNQSNQKELELDQANSKPKIILTEPSIDLDSFAIEQEQLLSSNSSNKLNVYAVKREQSVQENIQKEEKSNCWFSWFKVILDFNTDKDKKRELKDMFYYLVKRWYRELVLTVILLVCIFNAIRTSNLATRKAKLPEKFFPENSLIKEYEWGDIQELSQLAFQNEVTFVMYYAPWNSDCIQFKSEYLKISKYYKDQIFFAAVNCHYADGECAKSYKIKKFPVFIAHLRNIGEVEYKGLRYLS